MGNSNNIAPAGFKMEYIGGTRAMKTDNLDNENDVSYAKCPFKTLLVEASSVSKTRGSPWCACF